MPCGRRTKLKDIFMGFFKNYVVKFIKGKFNIIQLGDAEKKDMGKDTEQVGLFPEEVEENKKRNYEGKHQITPLGCGNTIDWTKMEDVTDEINKRLVKINVDPDIYVKNKIKSLNINHFDS